MNGRSQTARAVLSLRELLELEAELFHGRRVEGAALVRLPAAGV